MWVSPHWAFVPSGCRVSHGWGFVVHSLPYLGGGWVGDQGLGAFPTTMTKVWASHCACALVFPCPWLHPGKGDMWVGSGPEDSAFPSVPWHGRAPGF